MIGDLLAMAVVRMVTIAPAAIMIMIVLSIGVLVVAVDACHPRLH